MPYRLQVRNGGHAENRPQRKADARAGRLARVIEGRAQDHSHPMSFGYPDWDGTRYVLCRRKQHLIEKPRVASLHLEQIRSDACRMWLKHLRSIPSSIPYAAAPSGHPPSGLPAESARGGADNRGANALLEACP
jgi:hypothetical protein